MRYSLTIFLFLVGGLLIAQENVTISGSFEKAPFEEVIMKIESQTAYSFYFDPVWTDTLTFTGRFENESIDSVLKKLLEKTNLEYFVQSKSIILSNNIRIIGTPAIAKALESKKTASVSESSEGVEMGLIFFKEYMNSDVDTTNFERYTIEIGSRKKMVANGKSTIAGYVRNHENTEPLAGAIVYTEKPSIATTTDGSGFFNITIPNGKTTLYFQYYGMKPTLRNIVLYSSGQLNVDMKVDVIALQEVTVQADRDDNIQDVQMGVTKINVADTKNVPLVLGEKDIMKIATTFPGIKTIGEGSSGFNVRGGKSDQNLVLLNGATIYNASHFFGFFSVFNSDAIQSMDIYKSSIPAQYGGRLSSVFDVESKAASKEKASLSGGISFITSKLTLELPVFKGKSALLVSGRSTYSDWLLKSVANGEFRENRVSFSDLLVRYDHDLNDKNEVTVSGYYSKDNFRIKSDTLFSYSNFSFQNANASAKITHHFNTQLDGSLSAIYSQYDYNLEYTESAPRAFIQDFGIKEATMKADLSYFQSELHTVRAGVEVKRYGINPGSTQPMGSESLVAIRKLEEENAIQSAAYASYEYKASKFLTLYGGLRYTAFSNIGPHTVSNYLDGVPKNGDTQTDSTFYGKGKVIKTYHGPEVRLSAKYTLDEVSSIKIGYNRTRQYIHTLTNSTSLSPTDTWRISNQYIKPQIGDQYSAGYYRNFLGSMFETSVEVYYKNLQNLLDFKVGEQFLMKENIERVVLQGQGKSYGIEFSVKKSGKLNGWINYTFSRTFVKINGKFPEEIINEGAYYPANYDIPHNINLVSNYKMTKRVSLSYNFTYNTGRPVTYPVGTYTFKGAQTVYYADRNSQRIPDYIRMDIGVNMEASHKVKQLAHSYWSFSIYNLLGRDNPYSVFFDVRDGQVNAYKVIVFGNAIPTFSYNFKF